MLGTFQNSSYPKKSKIFSKGDQVRWQLGKHEPGFFEEWGILRDMPSSVERRKTTCRSVEFLWCLKVWVCLALLM